MDFDLSEDQREIKNVAAEMLSARSGLMHVREAAEARAYDPGLWAEMCALGWPGIAVEEKHGGAGLGCVESVMILEEHGYAVAASPLVSTMQAVFMLQSAGSPDQQAAWVPRLATGEVRGAVGAVREDGAFVPDGADADVIVLLRGDQATVAERADLDVAPVETIDPTRRYARVQGAGDPLPGDVAGGAGRAAIAVAAELVGISRRALDLSVAYANDRRQFDRAIGSFQAISHPCAEMLLATEGARSTTYFAAWSADADPPGLDRAAALAYSTALPAATDVTTAAIQIHGGIGFTWEGDVHWLYKRAQLAPMQLGGPGAARARLITSRLAA